MRDTRSVERSVHVITVEVVMERTPDGSHVVFADCVRCGDRLLESRRFPSDWGQNKLEVHLRSAGGVGENDVRDGLAAVWLYPQS